MRSKISQLPYYVSMENCHTSESLSHDEACLKVFSTVSGAVPLHVKQDECYQCGFTYWATIMEGKSSFVLNTQYPAQYLYFLNNHTCSIEFNFEEKGVYGLNVTEIGCDNVWIINNPGKYYLPSVVAFVAAVLSILLWKTVIWTWNSSVMVNWRQRNTIRTDLGNDLGNVTSPAAVSDEITNVHQNSRRRLRERIRALDTFRGLSIAVMIYVNYGGGGYQIFDHSPWNGLTVADLVFPWFAWIMGVSTSLFLRSQLRNTTSRKKLFFQILRRSCLLILMGIALNTIGGHRNGSSNIRILGVLQRLGLAYFVVASIEAVFMKPQRMDINGTCMHIEDILECWKQWVVVISLVACHVCLTFGLKVPGCPVGYLGPGGLHDYGRHENCTGGAAGYVDRVVLGASHLYQNPTCQKIYKTSVPYDPEGILGTMTTILLVFLGVQAGRILMTYGNSMSRITRWTTWSLLTGVIAGSLCRVSKEEGIIPINKNLWSLSYVLSTASMAFLLLALLFYVIDVRRWWGGGPFHYAGMNPLFLYVGHCLTKGMFPWFWEPFFNSHAELLAMNIYATMLWIFISYCLFHYNIFFSL